MVGDAGLAAMADPGLPPTLTTLDLFSNQIGDAGVAGLAKAGLPPALVTLDLSSNVIGDAGVIALANASARQPHAGLGRGRAAGLPTTLRSGPLFDLSFRLCLRAHPARQWCCRAQLSCL